MDIPIAPSAAAQLRLGCPLSPWTGRESACQWCDTDLPPGRRTVFCSRACVLAYERNHRWNKARSAAKRRARYRCQRCGAGKDADLEVNHIIPVDGAGYGDGCAHHQNNLETLCHDCHVLTTATQRAAGLITPRSQKDAPKGVS